MASAIFSAATGEQLTALPQYERSQIEFLGSTRSDVIYAGTPIDGRASFVSTSTWQPVFATGEGQSFVPAGIADNLAWGDGPAGRIVIETHTGEQVASDWRVYPQAGGAGWTLVTEDTGSSCCAHQWLLRGGTLRDAPPPPVA
jgi:hypothetical protein